MFKFCYLNGEKIEQIYVFSKEKEPNILFEDAAFQDIPITIIPHPIHLDDSIETIKKKMNNFMPISFINNSHKTGK